MVHIKRFRFSTTSREKLSTDVHFPTSALDLRAYLSPDLPQLYPSTSPHKSSSTLPLMIRGHNNNHHDAEHEDHVKIFDAHSPQKHVNSHGSTHGQESPSRQDSLSSDLDTLVHSELKPIYDLVGVCNHHGSLNGGHYIAHVDTNYGRPKEHGPRWMCFNDERVTKANASSIAGPTAYVLFYKLREDANLSHYYSSQNQEHEDFQHRSEQNQHSELDEPDSR